MKNLQTGSKKCGRNIAKNALTVACNKKDFVLIYSLVPHNDNK